MRHTFGRDQQIAGPHRQLAAIEQEHALAFDHLVDLVLPGVRVQRVFLAGSNALRPTSRRGDSKMVDLPIFVLPSTTRDDRLG